MRISLFNRIALTFLGTMIATNLLVLNIPLELTKTAFTDSYVQSQGELLDHIVDNFQEFNEENIEVINTYSRNTALNDYLTIDVEELKPHLFSVYYNIEAHFNYDNTNINPVRNRIMVLGNNNLVYTNATNILDVDGEMLKANEITAKAIQEPNKIQYFYGVHELYTMNPAVVAVKPLQKAYGADTVGIIYLQFETEVIESLFEKYVNQEGEIYVFANDGTVIAGTDSMNTGKKMESVYGAAQEMIHEELSYTTIREDKVEYLIQSRYVPILDMYIVNRVAEEEVLISFSELRYTIILIGIFITIIGLTIVSGISQRLIKPLKKVIHTIGQSRKGKFEKVEVIDGSIEVKDLQLAYNELIDEIKGYTEHLINIEQQKRFAELSALQMQINPHFLYNTLAMIKYLTWQGDIEKVTTTIEALIDLLQNTIGKTDEMIPLRQEISNLESYVSISKARFGEGIITKFYIDEELLEVLVPKLILQPFVENAYFHAFQNKKTGTIRIIVDSVGDELVCQIIDDGDGMENSQKGLLRFHFNGVGIGNVDQRIKLIFGENYGVLITGEKGKGTNISINLPKSKKSTNEE